MIILITGGLGYLGGRLARFLGARSSVRLRLGTRRSAENPRDLPGTSVVPMNWESDESLDRACAGVEQLVHLSGLDQEHSAADPVLALQVNAVATARLVRSAVRARVQRMILISTAHVYASEFQGFVTEETEAASLHPYATSHLARESVVRWANLRGELAGTVLRLSNAYGPPATPDAHCWQLLINDLCRQAVTTQRLKLRTTGLQRRNFIPVNDACRAIAHVLATAHSSGGKDVQNVGSDWSPTVWEAACLVRDRCRVVLGFEPELSRVPPSPGESPGDFEYESRRLEESGFRMSGDRTAEIDSLLDYCVDHFAK